MMLRILTREYNKRCIQLFEWSENNDEAFEGYTFNHEDEFHGKRDWHLTSVYIGMCNRNKLPIYHRMIFCSLSINKMEL